MLLWNSSSYSQPAPGGGPPNPPAGGGPPCVPWPQCQANIPIDDYIWLPIVAGLILAYYLLNQQHEKTT